MIEIFKNQDFKVNTQIGEKQQGIPFFEKEKPLNVNTFRGFKII